MSPLEDQVGLQLPFLQVRHQHSEQDEAGKEHQGLQTGVDEQVEGGIQPEIRLSEKTWFCYK